MAHSSSQLDQKLKQAVQEAMMKEKKIKEQEAKIQDIENEK